MANVYVSISGTVVNAFNGSGLAGATVTVLNTVTLQTWMTPTDFVGDFSLDEVQEGTYKLTATKSGYLDYEKDNLSAPVKDLVLEMTKENTTR